MQAVWMRYFIENRIAAWMLFSGLCLFGVIGMTRLPVSLMPSVAFPSVTVLIEYPQISPDRIDALITRPVERALRSVAGIQEIHSASEEGKSRIQLSFDMETDVRIAALRVRDSIGLIREQLPRAMQEPVVMRDDPGDRPAIILSIEETPLCDASLDTVREFAERNIRPALQRINGIARVDVAGGSLREIHIRIDRSRFDARAVTFDDIFSCLHGGNVFCPAGSIRHAGKEHRVVPFWKYSGIDDIKAAPVYAAPGSPGIRLSDIASVSVEPRERDEFSRLNGRERVMLYLFASGNANILGISANVKNALAGMKNVRTSAVYDQGDSIRASIRNVATSGLYGMIIIVILVCLFYRSALPAAVVSLSIPVSLTIVFAFMYFAGIPVDIMTGTGLALSAGMVVDNSVLVTETIYGGKQFSPCIIPEAMRSILPAMFASTSTSCIVFLPILFSDIIVRRMYGAIAFTITVALGSSLLVAVVLVPALYAEAQARGPAGKDMHSPIMKRARPWVRGISDAMTALEKKLRTWYERALAGSLAGSRMITCFLLLFALLSVFSFAVLKSDVTGPMGSRALYAYLEFPMGTSIQATNGPVLEAEKHLLAAGISDTISSKVEKSRGTLTINLKTPAHLSNKERR
jgi:HAE1 family hydrophobic/amphiphilic exporter-1